jgi:archaellum component FlaC
MAARRRGGQGGEVRDLTVEVLKDIRRELVRVNERLEGVDARLEGIDARLEGMDARFEGMDARFERMEGRLEALEAGLRRVEREAARGFEAVSARIDHLLDFSGERWRDHEERLRRLEDRLRSA